EPVDSPKLFEEAVRGIVGRLDDYSAFLPHKEKSAFDEALDQQYGGVGIELGGGGAEQRLTVASGRPGAPAGKAGSRPGDAIVTIDGHDTSKLPRDDARELLRGQPGTQVAIAVERPGNSAPLTFQVTRALIKVDSVLGDLRQENGEWNFLLPGDDRI